MTTISKQVRVGDSVSIQATTNTGYNFSGWNVNGSEVSTSNPYTFTPNSNISIDAVFSEAQAPLSWRGSTPITLKNRNGQTQTLWNPDGYRKYYGDIEGFGINDIVSVYINNPDSSDIIYNNNIITEIDMNGLTNLTLGKRSFSYCTALTTVVLPSSSYSIESGTSSLSGAFQGCTSLSSLTLGNCTSIGNYTFKGCTSLGTVNLPSSCTSIGNQAFQGCTRLRTLNFASTGTALSIGILAFQNCDIRALEFPSYLTEIVESSYGICYDVGTNLNIPNKNNGCNPFQYNSNLASITMPTESTRYKAEGNCLIDKQYKPNAKSGDTGNHYTVIVGCKNSVIPTTAAQPYQIVSAIGAAAFMGNSGLTAITIPERIKYIEAYAFYDCSNLATITFTPDSGLITNAYLRICGEAFGYCTSLSSITFPSRMKQFGNSFYFNNMVDYSVMVFNYCSNLSIAYLNAVDTPPTIAYNQYSEYIFPSTIQKIYVKPGTMSAYQNDSGWSYWYGVKKLYIGVSVASSSVPSGSSTVSTSSNNVDIQSDSPSPTVILTATPDTGYTFSSWKRGSTVLSSSNPYTATVVDNGTGTDTFTAYSEVSTYTISASVDPSGSGSISGNSGTYSYGDTVSLTATAASGYDFSEWTENGTTVSSNSTYSFTATQDRTLIAVFVVSAPRYTVQVALDPDSSVSPAPTFTGGGSYPAGTQITISVPNTYYVFQWWNSETEEEENTYDPETGDLIDTNTITKRSLDGIAQDANSFTYTVGTTNTTIYCTCEDLWDDCYMSCIYTNEESTVAPAFDLYDSNDTLLDTWYGILGDNSTYDDSNVMSDVYKITLHPETIEYDDGENTYSYEVYPQMQYLQDLDLVGFHNLHTVDFGTYYTVYDDALGEDVQVAQETTISCPNITLPPSCVEIKNAYFSPNTTYYSYEDEWGNTEYQEDEWVPEYINFGNVQIATNVSFDPYLYGEQPPQQSENWFTTNIFGVCTESITTITKPLFNNYPLTYLHLPHITGTYYGANNSNSLIDYTIPNTTTSIGTSAFYGCTNIREVSNLPNTLTSIGENAFRDCTSLTTATLGNSITSIQTSAFSGCTGLTSITLPSTLTTLGSEVFYQCTALTSITLPNTLTTISGSGLFRGCNHLTTVNLPNALTTIGMSTFYECTALTSITLPSTLTTIQNMAFKGCTGLTSITLPNALTTLGSQGFDGCTGLTSITIPNTLTTLSSYVFRGCTSLATVNLSNTLTAIQYSVFDGCTSLATISLPNTLTSISSYAFRNTAITSLTLPSSLRTLSNNALSSMKSITTFSIPSGITSFGTGMFSGCSALTSVSGLDDLNITDFSSMFNGCPALVGNYTNPSTGHTVYKVPSSVNNIGSAFYGCTALEGVLLPGNSINSGAGNAFRNCTNLEYVEFQSGGYFSNISQYTFYNCEKLKTMPDLSNITALGQYAFYNCKSIDATTITIPTTITVINEAVFYGLWNNKQDQTVRTIYVPYTVRNINKNAFRSVGGRTSSYEYDDWDEDGKPSGEDLYVNTYGPVVIEIGDSTNGSNLYTTSGYYYGLNPGSFNFAKIYKTDCWTMDTSEFDDDYPTRTANGGQGYIKFYGTSAPTLTAYNNSNGPVFDQDAYDLGYTPGGGDSTYIKRYKPKIYVPSASLSDYQTKFSTYISNNAIELEGF